MKKQSLGEKSKELIVEYKPKSPAAEAYRELRTNISYLSPDNRLNKIAVTSSCSKEGKSLITANLAIAMAHNRQELIIIDADLRKPRQHKLYDLPNYQGLSNILTGEISFEEGLQETWIERLKIISAGSIPPNPAELLSSHKMGEVISKAEAEADFVIIDTPPILAVTDAAVLAKKADGVLLVAASHEVEKEMLKKSKEKLEKANADIIGTVLNKHPVNDGRNYNYYYYPGQKA